MRSILLLGLSITTATYFLTNSVVASPIRSPTLASNNNVNIDYDIIKSVPQQDYDLPLEEQQQEMSRNTLVDIQNKDDEERMMATEHDSLHKRRHHSDKKHKKEERDHTKDKHKDKKNSHRHSKIRKNSRLDKKQQHHSNKRHKKTASSSSKKSGGGFDHHGVATFYSPDKGSCGWRNTKDDLIAAVNKDDMDNKKHESDKNPNCGRMIEIENNKGDTVKVKVVDTCPGCKKGSLDLSPAAFIKLASYKQGVVPIKWKYLD